MNEKKWTDDERDEAFDRGMETMQRVALELYRRGREPLLEELEEARARNADMRAMLEQVTRERDEARAELAALRKRVVEALPYPTDDDSDESRTAEEAIEMAVAERDSAYRSRDLAIKMWDEARAEVERVRKHYAASVLEHGKMLVEAVDSAKRQKSLADRAHDQACRLAAKLDARSTDQFRRGAEAMREACAMLVLTSNAVHGRVDADALRALPISEDKP